MATRQIHRQASWLGTLAVWAMCGAAFPRELEAEYPAWQRNNLSGVSETAVILRNSGDLTLWSDNLSARIYAGGIDVPSYRTTCEYRPLTPSRL